jgi:antitoxin MazE
MHAKIVRIGNSRGLRLPKALIEACGIRDTVDISLDEGLLIVRPVRSVREGWAEAAQAMAARGEDRLLDPETPTTFDETEWEW